MTIKHSIKQFALRQGIEIRRYDAAESADARFARQLAHHGIELVLDVGANDGGYGRLLRSLGYAGDIVSIEPLVDAHAALVAQAAADPRWFVAPRLALGDAAAEIEINVAGNSTSSSLLPMNALHERAAPQSRYQGRQKVNVQRLDAFEHPAIAPARRTLLKIDTQGYELPVLRGAEGLLSQLNGVQVELSVAPLYDGQALYREVVDFIVGRGFELWNLSPGFTDRASGRMLQFDGLFFRAPRRP